MGLTYVAMGLAGLLVLSFSDHYAMTRKRRAAREQSSQVRVAVVRPANTGYALPSRQIRQR